MKRSSLRWFALPFAFLAVSNLIKPLEWQPELGLVFLGRRLSGMPNLMMGPLLGAYMAAYAWGIWNARRYALPMGILYAGWVPLNIYLFTIRSPEELGTNSLFGVAYTIVAVAVSLGTAVVLMRSAGELR